MTSKKVTIVGVLMDLGADRRGVDMGPSAVRVANLNTRLEELGYDVTDSGNISVRNPEMMSITDSRAKYLHEIAVACQKLADQVEYSQIGGRRGARRLADGRLIHLDDGFETIGAS